MSSKNYDEWRLRKARHGGELITRILTADEALDKKDAGIKDKETTILELREELA